MDKSLDTFMIPILLRIPILLILRILFRSGTHSSPLAGMVRTENMSLFLELS